ncbi:hypothetical protein [Hyphobacterium marinum]|uniref:Secreted protein n=1 Tax=Hyphobacterium marinum TaxID=3116574 RepID=A0ABU7M1Q9_9PROT|nr:hypothetical protein [Hyphobacterium sp. Y6023]MEE2567741.1 hypothetical protein [Hyphobacterium sp. Y6023]
MKTHALIRTHALILAGLTALAAPAAAQMVDGNGNGVSSAYTRISITDCDVIEGQPETGDFVWRCEGHDGIPVWVAERHLRMYVSYGEKGRDEMAWQQTPIGFNGIPDPFTIEWRLAKYDMVHAAMGQDYPEEYDSPRPFATVLRWNVTDPETSENLQYLVVTNLGEGRTCHTAYVNSRQENANVLARETSNITADFNCELDEVWVR